MELPRSAWMVSCPGQTPWLATESASKASASLARSAVDVDDHVEVEVGPLLRPEQFGVLGLVRNQALTNVEPRSKGAGLDLLTDRLWTVVLSKSGVSWIKLPSERCRVRGNAPGGCPSH